MAGQSKAFTLNTTDWQKWLKDIAIFGAPAVLIFLMELQAGSSLKHALDVLYVWGLQTAINLLKKYIGN